MKRPFRIEICGGIASGKTTLAKLFKSHADLLFEDFTATPFWKPFYETPGPYNFEAEVSFLLQHYHQVKRRKLDRHGRDMVVCDFSYRLDRAYSTVSLDAREFHAFEAIYNHVLTDTTPPGLLIQLRCSAETQMQRINARARTVESGITVHFLRSLNAAIDREISIAVESMPTVSLDSETQDFAHDVKVTTRIRRQIMRKVSELSTLER